jgi:putative nucleotidyltransferase with HDIG domain
VAAPVEGPPDLRAAHRRLQAAYQQSLVYAREMRDLYRRLQRATLQGLQGLANALEAKDPYTRGHSGRVAVLARRIALALGWDEADAEVVAQAGLLHDIGKIGVPESVLGKPGPLTEDEWVVMRGHPVVGGQIVAPLDFFSDGALIVRHHHERFDGSGYPDGLAGRDIPAGARVVAVADVYDALTSSRPYRAALPEAVAVAELARQAGRTLDPDVVGAFLGARHTG